MRRMFELADPFPEEELILLRLDGYAMASKLIAVANRVVVESDDPLFVGLAEMVLRNAHGLLQDDDDIRQEILNELSNYEVMYEILNDSVGEAFRRLWTEASR